MALACLPSSRRKLARKPTRSACLWGYFRHSCVGGWGSMV